MWDRLLGNLVAQLEALHAWRVSGSALLGAFGLGLVIAGFVVPACISLVRKWREFSAWHAWRAEQREREAKEEEDLAEVEAVRQLVAHTSSAPPKAAPSLLGADRTFARVAPEVVTGIRSEPAPELSEPSSCSSDASEVTSSLAVEDVIEVFGEASPDPSETIAWLLEGVEEHAATTYYEKAIVLKAPPSGVRLPRPIDMSLARSMLDRRGGLA